MMTGHSGNTASSRTINGTNIVRNPAAGILGHVIPLVMSGPRIFMKGWFQSIEKTFTAYLHILRDTPRND
jgi:hypothetical protein